MYRGKPLSNYVRVVFGFEEFKLENSVYTSELHNFEGRQCTKADFKY